MITLKTDKGVFDLFESNTIVQSLSVFNFENITGRNGEFTNVFDMPLTANNSYLLEYADYINTINTTPYQKINCKILLDGLDFKAGFLVIEELSNIIKARFISGNSNFYNLIKDSNLNDLDWSAYDHTWNYTNAVARASATTDYVYPLMTYNGQTLTGVGSSTVDVRKILPATYVRAILDNIFATFGYTSDLNFDTSDLDVMLLPYAKKNPTVSAAVLLLNSVDVKRLNDFNPPTVTKRIMETWIDPAIMGLYNAITINIEYTNISTVGSSGYYDFINRKYVAHYSGNFTITSFLELNSYAMGISVFFNSSNVVYYAFTANVYIRIYKKSGNTITLLKDELIANISAGYNNTSSPVSSIGSFTTTPTGANTATCNVHLNSGDEVYTALYVVPIIELTHLGLAPVKTYLSISPSIKLTPTLKIDLSPELVFGGLITYSSMLPKIKCSDFFRDICIRFGLIPTINDDTKVITLNKFDEIYKNITSAIDWSDKIDDTTKPVIAFKYNSYAQNNLFEHKEDKTIISTDAESNYDLIIANANLETEKTIYASPFGVTENVTFNTTTTAWIDLYDTAKGKFTNDVQPRICFSENAASGFKFTDGTTTSAVLTVRRIWFIDQAVPEQSAGFGSMIPKNSAVLIDALQNLKLFKVNVKLNLLDILNLDFLIPVYIAKYDSYFFISNISQYDYTEDKITNVELIKLNP